MSGSYSLLGVSWAHSTITYSFATTTLDPAYPFSGVIPADIQASLRAAILGWEAQAGISLVQVGDSAAADIRIGWGLLSAGTGGTTIGITAFPHQFHLGDFEPDVIVRLLDPVLGSLVTGADGRHFFINFSGVTLEQIAAHEVGHALGLGHSIDINALMYAVAGTGNATIGGADVAGIQALYGAPFVGTAQAGTLAGPIVIGFDNAERAALAEVLIGSYATPAHVARGAGTYSLVESETALVSDAVGPITVLMAGNPGRGRLIATGTGGLTTSASGSGTIIAGGGANTIGLPSGFAGDWTVVLGDGNDIVQAQAGNDTVQAGGGANLVFLGSGDSQVTAAGVDTIIGGAGAATVRAVAGAAIAFAGSGRLEFHADAGVDTVIGNAGRVFVVGGPGGGLFTGGSLGGNAITAGAGAATILGAGPGDVLYAAGSGGDLVAGGAGSGTVSAEASLGNDTLFAGAGDTLLRGGFGLDILVPGPGADTIQPGPGAELLAFIAGRSGGADVVEGFVPGYTAILLAGYGTDAVTTALAGAVVSPAGVSLALPDGTTVLFAGVAGLTPANFL